MKAVTMELSLEQVAKILLPHIANIPAGAALKTMWTDVPVDYLLTRSGPPRLIVRIEHESYAEVVYRIPEIAPEIVAIAKPERKPAAKELSSAAAPKLNVPSPAPGPDAHDRAGSVPPNGAGAVRKQQRRSA